MNQAARQWDANMQNVKENCSVDFTGMNPNDDLENCSREGKASEHVQKSKLGKPGQVADRIAGATVDIAYRKPEDPKIAVEMLIGHVACHIIAETSMHIGWEETGNVVLRITGSLYTDYV